MEHIKNLDLLLFSVKRFSLITSYQDKQRHVNSCQVCQQKISDITKKLAEIKDKNKKECQPFLEQLLVLMDKPENFTLSPELSQHCSDCEYCGHIYHFWSHFPSVEAEILSKIQLPENTFVALDEKIHKVLASLEQEAVPVETDTYFNKAKKFITDQIHTYQLTLSPLPTPMPVRGDLQPESQIIFHKGGNLYLKTGHAFKKIILYAIFHEQVFEKITNDHGHVKFDNLFEDDYKVEIDGFEIVNIQEMVYNGDDSNESS